MNVCHMCGGFNRDQKRTSTALELELQLVASCSVWVLGIELGSLGFLKVKKSPNPLGYIFSPDIDNS